jgi:PAS domain S-box-containing protein
MLRGISAAAVIFGITLLTVGLLVFLSYRARRDAIQRDLIHAAVEAAQVVDAELHQQLVSAEQQDSLLHLRALEPLVKFHQANHHLYYVFTMVVIDDEFYFVLDTATDERAPRLDDKVVPSMIMEPYQFTPEESVMIRSIVVGQGLPYTKDDYLIGSFGTFLTAFAPIKGRYGKVVALAGVDFSLDSFSAERREIWWATGLSLLLAVALSLGVGLTAHRYARDERRSIEALTESERRFRELAELLPAMVVELDQDGMPVYANAFSLRQLGYSAGDIPGLVPVDLIAAEDQERFRSNMAQLLAGEETTSSEYLVRRKDGSTIPVLAQSTPIVRNGRVTGLLGVMIDLSERKALESRLSSAAKMEVVGQLAGGIAHDFNNMLAVVIGYTEILQRKAPTESELKSSLQMIMDAGTSAANVAGQLLAFSRHHEPDMKIVNVNTVTGNLAKMLKRVIGEHIELSMELESALPAVKADPAQVEQVLMNLIVNARDAMPEGGRLTIRTTRAEAPDGIDSKDEGWISISVADTGHGIEEQDLERIFEPFYTTKAPHQGTGLGLASVTGIVTRHGGHIEVSSRVGEGTELTVYLPCSSGEAEPAELDQVKPSRSITEATVLVVEDDDRVRAMLAEMLWDLGCRTLFASSPSHALRIAKEPDQVDLILTDVIMPEMNGKELAGELIKTWPGAGVVFMSGYSADILAHYGVTGESVRLLRKPFTIDELQAKLEGAMRAAG